MSRARFLTDSCARQWHDYCEGVEGVCSCRCHVPGLEPSDEEITTAEAWRRYLAASSEADRTRARAVFVASLERWRPLG